MVKRKKLKGRARAKAIVRVRKLIGKQYSDQQICIKLDMRPNSLSALKAEIINFDKTWFEHLDSGTVYSDYLMQSLLNITDLNKLIRSTTMSRASSGERSAFVAAIKLRKEINDKCVKMGQDLGFIEKTAQEVNFKGEMDFNFSEMSDADVKAEVQKEVEKLNSIASGNVIEMRQELLGVTDAEVKNYLPSRLISYKKKRQIKKIKIKTRLTLRK